MARLTKEQLDFIKRMELMPDDLFDASGLRPAEWKHQMKQTGKLVAFGVTPCQAKGHSLRTRSGHCVQCNTAVLAYHKRYSKSGDVYLAWSPRGMIAKIGSATDADVRLKSLIDARYGGQKDWSLELIYECIEAGRLESLTHKLLRNYSLRGLTYSRDGRQQECTELFRCTLKQAKAALEKAVQELNKS